VRSRDEIELEVRRLLARELHDRIAQTLTGMLVDVENFKSEQVEWNDVLRQLDTVQNSTRQVLSSLRQVIHDLRGEDDGGSFIDAVRMLVERFQEKTRISVDLSVGPGWPQHIAPPAALNLYRIVEEALANVRMHSSASAVLISLDGRSESELSLVVSDDGRGLDTDVSRPVGQGTVGMKERALFLGGILRIDSVPGGGTTVRAVFPDRLLVSQDPLRSMPLAAKGISA
jgi:signal transduction histidine kinase